MLECRSLVKRFAQKTAIDDVSFEVKRGEIVGLLGPNGAGKTTLIRMIIDIFRPDEGEIFFLSRKMFERNDQGGSMRDLLGYLPEERGLYRRGKLAETIEYLARLHGVSAVDARQRVAEGLDALGFGMYANRRVVDLSKGMMQRVQFLAASVHRPQLMILDEPFSGLDPVGVQWAMEQIKSFHAMGATILLSAHQMAMVERACDRVVMVNQGRRVLYGSLDEIYNAHARDRVLVTTSARLDQHVATHGLTVRAVSPSVWEVAMPVAHGEAFLRHLVAAGLPLEGFAVQRPTLEEIFLEVVAVGEPAA